MQPNNIVVSTPQRSSPSLVMKLAGKYGVDADKMLTTLKATAFRQKDVDITNEQMMALLIVADQYGLNPFTKEIYAFPDKGGIVPVVGVDGWARIINEHAQFDGMDFAQDEQSCTCTIHRKDRSHPIQVTEYMSECKRTTPAWSSHPKRMLRHKTMIQCSRIAFGFVGIHDDDEAERIVAESAKEIPKGKGVIKPTSGAWEELDDERREILLDIADKTKTALSEDRDYDAHELISGITDTDEAVAIWTRFDSKERARLKKAAALASTRQSPETTQ